MVDEGDWQGVGIRADENNDAVCWVAVRARGSRRPSPTAHHRYTRLTTKQHAQRVEHSLNGDWKLMANIERKLGQLRTTTRRYGLCVDGA